jgi:hypothetical protein
MPANPSRSATRVAVLLLLVLLIGGCGGQTNESAAGGQATTSTTVAPTTTTVPPLTAEELAWLKAVPKLQESLARDLQQSGITLTRATMTSYANRLRACSRELARIGSPSDRLEPVHATFTKACRTFDKGAKCWATAARVSMADGGVIAGTPQERTQSRAIECGSAAVGDGLNLLIQAEAEGEEIKARYG